MFFSHHEKDRKAAFAKGDWNNVILHGEHELKKTPDDVRVLNDLAFAYYNKQDFDHALKLCETIYRIEPGPDLKAQAKKIGPRYMRYHEILADMYFMQGRDEEALAICNNLKALTTLFSKKHTISARIYARRGNMTAAIKEYAAMAKNCPDHFKEAGIGLKGLAKIDPLEELPYRNLYALYIQHNELDSIIARLESLCSAGQIDLDSLYSLIYMYYFNGSYEKEIKLLHQKMAEYKDNSHLYFFLAKAFLAIKKPGKARQSIDRAIAMAPQYADKYKQLRNEMASNEERTRQELEKAIRQDVRNRQPYKVIDGYDRLLEAHPDHLPYWIGLAQAIAMAIDLEIAGGELEKAFELLDQLKLFAENYPAVKKTYEARKIRLTPKRIEYYATLIAQGERPVEELSRMRLILARLYIQTRDTGSAVQHWKAVIKEGGEARVEAIFRLASHLLQIGKTELAEPYIQQFVNTASYDNEETKGWMYELGIMSEKFNLRSQARNLYGKLSIEDKKYRDVAQRLEALNQGGYSEEAAEGVMVLDICESSRMMDLYGDEATNSIKNMLETMMFPIFKACGAKFHKSTGDGFLVTFPEADQAVKAAIKILREVNDYNTKGKGIPVHLRFAVHFGAIRIRADGDRHGTNINIPFRVEGLKAENLIEVEGGMQPDELPTQDRILITEAAWQRLQTHKKYSCRYVGLFELRNITGVHKIYQLLMPASA